MVKVGASSNLVDDATPQLGGTLDTNDQQIRWSKGADISSATALSPGTDGNYFDVTGTTTITSIATMSPGTVVALHFDAALTFTHHSTNLALPGAANITTAANDEAILLEYDTGKWRCLSYTKASGAPVTASSVAKNPFDISGGGEGQILFPATQNASGNANTLDDYEEGDWTGTFSDGTNDCTMTSTNDGTYTKVGRVVFITGDFECNSLGSASGDMFIKGLPFVGKNTESGIGALGIGRGLGLAISAGSYVACHSGQNVSTIALHLWDATTGSTALQHSELSADGRLLGVGGSYTT
tara:strand:+ start:25 stop:918 length:894 start_codon:yes stop_codon:yes gene_type:complete